MGPFLFILLLIVVLAFCVTAIYNSLVKARNEVKNSWANIEVQLQRRFDLIPNLIETIKGYMDHETKLLSKVTELRSSWEKTNSVSEKANLNNELTSSVKNIVAVAEQYPELKSNTNFLELQSQLESTEASIAASRSSYNNIVTAYNTKLEIFPNNIVGGMFNFKNEELFRIENDEVRENVKVSF